MSLLRSDTRSSVPGVVCDEDGVETITHRSNVGPSLLKDNQYSVGPIPRRTHLLLLRRDETGRRDS